MSLVNCIQKANKVKRVFASAEVQELTALATENRKTMEGPEAERAAVQALLDEANAELAEVVALIVEAAPQSASKPAKVAKPSANTIFTEDAAEKARAILRRKLGQLNSGLDPEMMQAGITLAGYHIEKGARSFAAYANAMLGDLGDSVRPYLKSWYMAVAFDPRASGFTDKMDDPSLVKTINVDDFRATAAPTGRDSQPSDTLRDHLRQAIIDGKMPKDNPALRKMVQAFDGVAPDQPRMKVAQEALESAIVQMAREVVAKKEGDRTTFDILKRLYDAQPNLNIRTSDSIERQAYSTPAPLAYLGARLADVTQQTTMYEPTGGNGMLAITASPGNVTATELDPQRADSLKAQGFNVTQGDALEANVPAKSQDRVMTNPPFGPIKNDKGESVKVKFAGYTLGQIDHLIAARALETMKDDGNATLIIGANKATGQQSNNDLIFFNWLYGNYNVTSHFEVEGDLYQRQGAGWPVRVITIKGRMPSAATAPNPTTIQRANTWSEVYEQFQQGMDAGRAGARAGASPVGAESRQTNDAKPVPGSAAPKTGIADSGRSEGSSASDGNVTRERARPVVNRAAEPAARLGERSDAVGSNDQAPGPVEDAGIVVTGEAANAAGNPGAAGVTSTDPDNQFQTRYIARSDRKDEGVLIPVNMAGPTQDALNRLEDEVGNIDQFAAKELGYKSVAELHRAFMGLQVDSVASAISQIKAGKGIIIADQTGIGKGRQAAGIIRWAARNGKTPIFVTVKPSLFTDMYGDLHDIGTDNIQPLLMNSGESIKGAGDERLFANQPALHKRVLEAIASSGRLPKGRNALFMTYSQINVDNIQRKAVMALAPNAVFVLDESHNAGGASATGEFIKGALDLASGVTYLSATYAKRPDNMPVYFKTDIGEAVADDNTLMAAMAAGGLPLQTVVSNNLVKAGQMFRRERSYDGVSIESRADTEHKAEHVKLSDETTLALRAIVSADRTFHNAYVKALQKELEKEGSRVLDMAGNQAQQSVDHTQFSSVVHNFVRQMLLGLKAQEAANDAVRSIKRGEKPLIAVEGTMGSFLAEYAENNSIKVGDSLGLFDYRTVLTRALERSRYIVRQLPNGDKVKEYIPMGKLDPLSFEAYTNAQAVIDKLKIDIPVSPIDWMRDQITKAGYTVAEVTGRNLSVDYSDPKRPKLAQIDQREQKDKVRTTRQFNDGTLDAIILNVAGSTGISLHASEKFKDKRQRHMIVAQAAQDINIFMQMLGRVHRTGQVVLPKYTLLSADLPAEIRPTALLSGKMKSLNANTSSNTESATSVKAADMLNKYGDTIVQQYLADNFELAQALDLTVSEADADGEGGVEDIARKATGRLALMPVKTQEQFYAEVEEQYQALIDYLNKTNQNDLEPRTFDFDAQETKSAVLFEGQNKSSPFGEDALYGEYSVKAQGKAMSPEEIRAAMAEHLAGSTAGDHLRAMAAPLQAAFNKMRDGMAEEEQKAKADIAARAGAAFLDSHKIGSMFRVEISGESYNAIVTNIRSTHKATGNPFSLSKIQVTIAVNGALRSVTLPATQFNKIETSRITGGYGATIEAAFREGPRNERETAKIVTGNLLGAYGEIEGARGSIITFSKADGTTEQGILLPKAFNFKKDVRQDYRLKTAGDVFKFLTNSANENIDRFGINSRDSVVRVLPSGQNGVTIQVPKSKAKGGKYFLDKALREAAGDFVSSGNFMRVTVTGEGRAKKALEVLMQKGALYALPSMAQEARQIVGDAEAAPGAKFSRALGARAGLPMPDAEAVADAIRAAYPTGPQIVVLDDVRKAPESLLDQINNAQAANTVEGAYYKGKIYLFPQNVADIERLMFVGAHHEIRHAGLDALFGKRKGALLLSIAMSNPKVAEAARAKMADGLADSMVAATEEALADMPLEDMAKLNGWDKIVAAVRQWLRGMADRLRRNHPKLAAMIQPDQWTDNDVAALIRRAEDISRGGTVPARAAGAVFSRADQTQTPAFLRWFGDSKVVDAQGKPLVVYHGTNRNFTVFSPGNAQGWGTGIYLTDNAQEAAEHGGNVMPVYVSLQNPWIEGQSPSPDATGTKAWAKYLKDRGASTDPDSENFVSMDDALAEDGDLMNQVLREFGYDGIIAKLQSGQPGQEIVAFRPEQIKSATDNNGNFDPGNADIRFSRTAGTAKVTAQRQVTQAVRNTVADMLGSAGAKVSWWDKTLGTQYAKAQKFPAYKRVFDQVQQYLEDTSAMANEAADQAKSILPKLETWKDLKKFGLKPEDAKAVAGPIFTGTLTDQKVYSDAELRSQFKLTDAQIDQYRQFMAAVNTSLDQAMAAEALRLLGDKNAALRELALTDRGALRQGIAEFLSDQAVKAGEDVNAQGEDRGKFTLLRDDIAEKYQRIGTLKSQGYAPLMRFGQYKVNITDPQTGETLFFGLYESKAAANEALRDLRADPEFAKADFEQGVLSAEQYKLFSAMPLDSLEMFAEAIGADQSEVFQDFIRLAKNNRSAMKRLLKRKGTAGFSEDVPRVLAAFVTSNARMAAGALNMPSAKEAAMDIRDGDIQDEAIKLLETVQNPTDTAGAVRSLMFVNFIGGSIASAVVNLTQPLTMTLPYLSQFGGGVKAAKRLMTAGKMVASGKVDDMALRVALKRAETDGIVSPQEIHHLTAQAMGTFGTNPYLQRAAFIWAAPFSLAEQFNRRVSFIAAFNTAKEQGIEDPFSFAEKAVTETQGLYNKGNAPNLARGTIGAAALTFRQFSIHYLEWMGRMWKSGPEGKKAVGIALALLILAAGTDGLPFADDLDDLIDTLAEALGYDLNIKKARREFVAETLGAGDVTADILARGITAVPGVPLDASIRMSMGNLLPGTGLFLRSNTDKSRDLLEVAGPAGGLVKQYIEAGTKALQGDMSGAVQSALPVAFQNAFKGVGMWTTGEARDTLGRKVMDADEVDGLMKFIGFQPQAIARESEKIQMIRRSEQLAKNVEGEIASAWARAIVDKDPDGVADARAKLAAWNEDNPDSPIRIKMQQIIQRAKKLREDRASRFITSVSPERRRAVAEALE